MRVQNKNNNPLQCLSDNLDSTSDLGPFVNLKTVSHQDKCLSLQILIELNSY